MYIHGLSGIKYKFNFLRMRIQMLHKFAACLLQVLDSIQARQDCKLLRNLVPKFHQRTFEHCLFYPLLSIYLLPLLRDRTNFLDI